MMAPEDTDREAAAPGKRGKPVVCIEGLTVRYGKFVAVDQLDLEIGRGELFGLLGPNGAGKSSTLRVLIGQRRPSSGRVMVLGRDITTDWADIKPDFGYVPDRENHFEELSGRRNLQIFAGLYSVDEKRVDECLRMVELHRAASTRVRAYSLGMRRKLLLARAVLHQPRILYLDEPTANLDVHSATVVHDILRALASEGCAVMLTTHDMHEVEALCDRVAILRDGKRVALGTPGELLERHGAQQVDVVLTSGEQLTFELDRDDDRTTLAKHVRGGEVASLRTRSVDFRDAFLEVTGKQPG